MRVNTSPACSQCWKKRATTAKPHRTMRLPMVIPHRMTHPMKGQRTKTGTETMSDTNRPTPPGLRYGTAEPVADHVRPVRIGLYPGTFDPVTNGHIDVIARAARLLDKLIVGVSISAGKGPMFPLEERVELVQAEIKSIAKDNGMVIEVMPFNTLLIDFARKVGA